MVLFILLLGGMNHVKAKESAPGAEKGYVLILNSYTNY